MSGVDQHPETVPETGGDAGSPASPLRRDYTSTLPLGCKTPLSVSRQIAQWSPVAIAKGIEDGVITHWPHEFTRLGWRWVRRRSDVQEATNP